MARYAEEDCGLVFEITKFQRLIQGYSSTHARGQSKFTSVLGALGPFLGREDTTEWVARLRTAEL